MYDAIVVGARCAGAVTGMLLARKGYKVLIIDRATIPSEIPHGHFIHRQGPRMLRQWGLLNPIAKSGCPLVTQATTDLGDFALTGTDLQIDAVPLGCGPRRAVLDRILIHAAVAAGAELRQDTTVDAYLGDGTAISGIRGRSHTGARFIETARITIGADGRNSTLARTVRAVEYHAAPTATCWYFSYWGGVAAQGFEHYLRDRCAIFAFPTNGGLTGIFIAWPIDEFVAIKSDIERRFLHAIDLAPDFAERVRAGNRAERYYGAADLPNYFRQSHGPGWALVGDAGHHKDPYMAFGISDAFRDSLLLAAAVDAGLSGARDMLDALQAYETSRLDAAMPDYQFNLARARFEPFDPDFLRLRAALRHNPEDTRQLFMAMEGMISPADFFAPANVARIRSRSAGATGIPACV